MEKQLYLETTDIPDILWYTQCNDAISLPDI